MTRYDLAGNPLPEPAASETPPAQSLPGNAPPQAAPPPPQMPPPAQPTYIAPAPMRGNSAPPANNPGKSALLIGLGLLAVIILFVVAKAAKPERVAAPARFVSYAAVDKAFTCEGPKGWETISAGADGTNNSGVLFKNGHARMDISSDLVGSLFGDMDKAANAMASQFTNAPQVPPVEKLHVADQKAMEERFHNYKEQPMQSFTSRMGDARLSEFTRDGSMMTGKLHGYRVTMLGRERRYRVICQCRESDWNTLKPAFQHFINSLAEGAG